MHIAPKQARRKRKTRASRPPGTMFLRCMVNTLIYYEFVPLSTCFNTQLGFIIGPLGSVSPDPPVALLRHHLAVLFSGGRMDSPMDWEPSV